MLASLDHVQRLPRLALGQGHSVPMLALLAHAQRVPAWEDQVGQEEGFVPDCPPLVQPGCGVVNYGTQNFPASAYNARARYEAPRGRGH